MRVSTFQVFNQNLNSLLKKQNSTADLVEQLSTGKKINTAADDPVSAIGIDNLQQQNALMDQFLRNIDYGTNRLVLAESKLGLAEDVGANFRENILQAVNGTLSSDGRQMIADEMRSSLEEMRNIANTKDESGNYIFAGFKTDTQPFVTDNAGNLIYRGDSGERQAAIATGVVLNTNIPGDRAFMAAPNALGDYQATYQAAQAGEFNVEKATIVNATTHVTDTYSFNFIDNGAGGINLEIRDSGNALVSTVNNYDSANTVSFNGMEVTVNGTPLAGDSFSLSPKNEISIFDTFNQAIQLVETNEVNTAAGRAKLAQILNNTDSALSQLSITRGEAGNHLKSLERYGVRHEDEKVVNGGALSLLEDLDYASAITEFEKQQLALNAVSSVFGKVGSISLFDYI